MVNGGSMSELVFENLDPRVVSTWTYKGKPCRVPKIARLDDRIRAVYVQLLDGTPEFVHIGLETDAFDYSGEMVSHGIVA